jgi:DNA-binding beta-propeller fold protein YncE
VTPDGSKLYTENEEDRFACVIDLKARKRMKKIPAPNGLAGIGLSPDGKTIKLVDAKLPQILIVDTASDEIVRTVRLEGHEKAAQIARYSPDGKYLIVTSHDAPLGTVFDAKLQTQKPCNSAAGR